MSDAPTDPEVFVAHANARTNEYGRRLAVQRCLAGHKVKDVAAQLGISRTTVYKWVARFAAEGPAGLADRSSRPRRSPRRVPLAVELAVLHARVDLHVGAVQLADELALPGVDDRRGAAPVGDAAARRHRPDHR